MLSFKIHHWKSSFYLKLDLLTYPIYKNNFLNGSAKNKKIYINIPYIFTKGSETFISKPVEFKFKLLRLNFRYN